MKQNRAFSLIELSIVILVIGVLVAGITQGSSLYRKFKIQTAQSLTRSSPVNGIKDLAAWYETSLDSSFDKTDSVNGNRIYKWNDANPQKQLPNNAINSSSVVFPNTCSNCPTYVEDGLNGLPVVYFDYRNKAVLAFSDENILYDTDITIFGVGYSGSYLADFRPFLRSNINFNFLLGFQNGGTSILRLISTGTPNGGQTSTMSLPGSGIGATPILLTAQMSQASGRKIWFLGKNSGCDNSDNKDVISNISGSNIYIGGVPGSVQDMNIAELIIFQRALTDEERKSVDEYLIKKYAINNSMNVSSCATQS